MAAPGPAPRPEEPAQASLPPQGPSQGEPAGPPPLPAPPQQQQAQQPTSQPPQQQQQPSPAEAKFQAPAQPPAQSSAPQASPTAAPPSHEQASFLPLVHDVIKCMDKDSQDVHQMLNELRTKFVEMRKLIKSMQGIGMSPEQQQVQLQNLREQVKTKSELLQKYKSLCMFEIPKE
ncbi:mediator of RNA polymerase II transcription subunit 9 [Anolis carolinensis]|uniref:Mediator of RNA polymerase II transcription subunit 9 n=1 Tax=Anolis carolinensis TaxID=28377 RepID=A0A803U081_ANOCA|nr:PREDICTED: mediator of RNA polymerase II transcription subunit 9 [Anolis carolinensis]|eukprot:XP_003227630.1 PREDICTED: mediator of RNA polymerase II transcription subunit 9 [Anolis carolinensis]